LLKTLPEKINSLRSDSIFSGSNANFHCLSDSDTPADVSSFQCILVEWALDPEIIFYRIVFEHVEQNIQKKSRFGMFFVHIRAIIWWREIFRYYIII